MAIDGASRSETAKELEVHVRDYSAFINIAKWGAILSVIVALVVMYIISN